MDSSIIKKSIKKLTATAETSCMLIFIVMLILTALLQENFFETASITRNINAFAPLILLAMGQSIVIISGAIDLSAGSSLSLICCVLTYVMKADNPSTGFTAILAAFAVAVLIGLINGFGVGIMRIPPVILTFATSYLFLGLALFVRPTPGGQIVNWFKCFYNFGSIENAPSGLVAFGKVIPPALILIVIGCMLWFIISKTKTGRYFYAVGSNPEGAYSSGINTGIIQIKAYILNSVFIFFTALYFASQNASGDARLGDPMTLKVIAAAVVGGISMSGGRGSVYFAIVGALIMNLVSKIIFFAGIPTAFQTLVSGLIIIVAISSSTIYNMISQRKNLKENT